MGATAWCNLRGQRVSLGHGDLIGRSTAAALLVDDARISEAHAFVSLRAGRLRLLALRGRFRVDGQVLGEVELRPGQVIELAEGLELEIDEVALPEWLLGVEGPDLPRQILPGTVALELGPPPRLRPGWSPDAPAVLWSLDEAWRISLRGGETRPLGPGDEVIIEGFALRAVEVPLGDAGPSRTAVGFGQPVRLESCFHTVRVQLGDHPPVVIGGIQGRLLAELVELSGPVGWEVAAEAVWGRSDDRLALRRRWDIALSRLRARLQAIGVRSDLVHLDGAGHVELVLREHDACVVLEG